MVYYVTSLQQQDYVYRFPRGFQYIAGFDLADPTQSKRTAIIAAPNAASTAGGGNAGYTRTINENANAPGFIGWKCEATNGGSSPGASPVNPGSFYQPYLKNADNTPTMVCPSNELIGFVINMQTCWDGHNLWSPDGRSHVMHGIRQSATRNMCPNGWFKLPAFELIVWFNHDGADDYKEWYFSSDRVPGGTTYKNGETGHADWYGGWDYEIMSAWMKNCIGITFEDGTGDNPNECNDSTLGDGRQMRGNNPPDNSRNPIWTATPLPSGPARYAPVPYNR